jgi:hypothetical protein
LSIRFDPVVIWAPPPTGKRVCQWQYSDAAVHTCLTLQGLFGLRLRQTTDLIESLSRLNGLYRAVPDFGTF